MNPESLLRRAEEILTESKTLSSGEIDKAAQYLWQYKSDRRVGVAEPENGDARMNRLTLLLAAAKEKRIAFISG